MHRDGTIGPPPPSRVPPVTEPVTFGPDTEPPPPLPAPTALDGVRPLEVRAVRGGTREGRLRNGSVARRHHLGYTRPVGARMRYAVHDRNGRPLAMPGFPTAAWRPAPRDRFIGWTPGPRERSLPPVVDSPRFPILPWMAIPNLGSHILPPVRRRLPGDWTARYGTGPVPCGTFVEVPRHSGGVHRASGWIRVGTTRGRGRHDRRNRADRPGKDIRPCPLRRDWKRTPSRWSRLRPRPRRRTSARRRRSPATETPP